MSSLVRGDLVRQAHHKRSGIKSYVHALQKWNITPSLDGPYCRVNQIHQTGSQSILKQFGKSVGGKAKVKQHVLAKKDPTSGQTGDVPAEDIENNAEYLANVTIGTPGQTFALDLDTGSADLWVWSTGLPASTRNGNHGGNKLSIFDRPEEVLHFQEVLWLNLADPAIELAKTLSTQFASGPGDGLLGLAFGSINTVSPSPAQTVVENMITQSDIPKNTELFTTYLGSTPPGSSSDSSNGAATADATSFYTFGYIDQTALAGQTPAYTPVDNSQGFWMFASESAQGWVFPNSTDLSSLPAVRLAIGDTLFTINPEELPFQDLGDGTFYGGIQSRGDQTFDIYGDVFLRSVCAIFDQGNTRFGCTQRASTLSSDGEKYSNGEKHSNG
ncbi:unnamed protein product [Zymoseptoria tritici ST99CH_1E4]|uniref:Peptidase A1 domain-containing protein n=1 Tax=Zymoseptoria tritici ST99CH_1E4 TaxID=1276532 RepID=A0A2H1GAA9_ZYMTR|nr:unnamed protein product [Zymoseptoria tritici ST99CH_1E4]